MKTTARLEWAIRIAATAHQKQLRKATNIPYIIHPFSVMLLASEATDDEDTLIACLFHDIIEDVPEEYSEEQMRADFGERVVNIVRGVTKDDSLNDWQERSDAYLHHLEHEATDESVLVSAADKTHNLMSMLNDYDLIGGKLWDKFNSGKERQLWWYQSVSAVVRRRLPDLPLNQRLDELMLKLETITDNQLAITV